MRGCRWTASVAVRRWIFLAYWFTMFAGTHTPRLEIIRPEVFRIPHADKVIHFCMFAGWMSLCWWLLRSPRGRPGRRAVTGAFLAGALYAAFDELTQSLVGRDTSFGDFLADIAGMLAALWVLEAWHRRQTSRKTA
ncbi:MAG TPA: VanZ family protein [Phycisphaerae bacterium]|nr:VanZ family protein [Phycisphaerae bacterium]HRR84857.1 VanZ family protein [Phycisphaerae bacterium]